jgi:hypothetical protein
MLREQLGTEIQHACGRSYLEGGVIGLAASLRYEKLDVRVRHAGSRSVNDGAPWASSWGPVTHLRACAKGKTASEDRSRWTLALFAVPMALSRGSGGMLD